MAGTRNSEVDKWFKKKKPLLEEAMQEARTVILSADKRITETVKWDTPTFVYKGNILSLTPGKAAVGLMFHRGAEIPGRHRLLEGDGKLVRTMRFKTATEVKAARSDITKAVKAWCLWRDKDAV
jgi:hypothetical protein